ncbi:CDP-diacylglycerol--glycerol-3-phosphate 3-phosphatidyltransferase [Encephalitozoon intestinalis]
MDISEEKFDVLDSVHVSGFRILKDSGEFYQRIKFLMQNSTSVCIASLFFGKNGEMEDIIDILEERKRKNLMTIIFIDKNRGTVFESLESIKRRGLGSFFHLVDLSTSFLLPRRLNELLRTFHTKALVFDGLTILSGANMDASYMTNRVDRYLEIDSRELADMIRSRVFGIRPPLEAGKTICQGLPVYVGMFKEKEEPAIVQSFLEDFDEIHISTGYLNFPARYFKMLQGKKVSLYASCPDKNTFDSFGPLERFIGPAYSYSFYRTLRSISSLSIHELKRDGHSFHLKGKWNC